MPSIYKTLHSFRDGLSSAGQTSGYHAEKYKLNSSLSKKELWTNLHCFAPILITASTAAVSFFKASNMIKIRHCSGPSLTYFKRFLRKPVCLFTCPNTTICFFSDIQIWKLWLRRDAQGQWQTLEYTISSRAYYSFKSSNTGFLHNHLIPFTRHRKYWLLAAIKGPDCKKPIKVSGYL